MQKERPNLCLEPVIAHRGVSAHAPENTLAAFECARAMGLHWVEFDVMLSRDEKAFVIHDPQLSRTTNGFGGVGLVSAEYLASLDAGSWFSARYKGELLPTFMSVLKWLCANDMNANIEIKPYPGKSLETVRVVLEEINAIWPQDKAYPLMSSFDIEVLEVIHKTAPYLPIGLLYARGVSPDLDKAKALNAYSIHLYKADCKPSVVKAIKEAGYVVCAYTVNTAREASRLFSRGVDSIFSNDPQKC